MTTTSIAKTTEVPAPVQLARRNRDRFDSVLPSHIEVKPFIGLAEAALYRDDKLMEAAQSSPQAFFGALMRCASLGHRPGTEEFYLVPRKRKGRLEIQGIEGYRGIVERMYRSGAVASVIVREVCANDVFEFIEGQMDKPRHVIDWFGDNRGQMVGVYGYAVMTNGAVSRVVVLSKADVMAAKAKSDGAASDYSPWNALDGGPDHPEFTGRSMWWKTAARRLEPWVPTSVEFFKERVRAAAEASRGATAVQEPAPKPEHVVTVNTDTGEVVDGEVVEDEPADGDYPNPETPDPADEQ